MVYPLHQIAGGASTNGARKQSREHGMGAERPPSTAQVALLMTRPQAASQRFVAELPEALLAGLRVIHAPLL